MKMHAHQIFTCLSIMTLLCLLTTGLKAQTSDRPELMSHPTRITLPQGSLKLWNPWQYQSFLRGKTPGPNEGRFNRLGSLEDTRIIIDLVPQGGEYWSSIGFVYLPGLPGQIHPYQVHYESTGKDQWQATLKCEIHPRRARPVFIGGKLTIKLNAKKNQRTMASQRRTRPASHYRYQ